MAEAPGPGELWAITVVGRVRADGRRLAISDDEDEDFDLAAWTGEPGVTMTRLLEAPDGD